MKNNLMYGTNTTDDSGDFATQRFIGSTFPNWNGSDGDSSQLALERRGNWLAENLPLETGAFVLIDWQLIDN